MNRQWCSRLTHALIVIALTFGVGLPALRLTAQSGQSGPGARDGRGRGIGRDGDSGEFILRASPDRIAAIASRYGLTVVRSVDQHNHGIFLVRGRIDGAERRRGRIGAIEQQLTSTVRGDADVLHFVPNEVVSIPESSGSAQLNQSTVVILDTVANTTSYFGAPVPTQYISQPAA